MKENLKEKLIVKATMGAGKELTTRILVAAEEEIFFFRSNQYSFSGSWSPI